MKKLVFLDRKFDCLICLDANLPGKEVFDKLSGIPILAADGAANKLKSIEIQPQFIIGDLDSLGSGQNESKFHNSEIIHLKDQETNDFEKNLKFAIEKGFENILILGIHGGLLEHTLNNWSVFMKYSQEANLCLFDEGRYAFSVFESISMGLNTDEIVSIIPQEKTFLSSKNLKWELHDEELRLGRREGARNQAISSHVEIEVHRGSILVFIDSRLPQVPIIKSTTSIPAQI